MMKRIPALFLGLLLLSTFVQAATTKDDSVKLNLPWEQIQRLLRLNQDEVRLSWEEFQALIQRTSEKSLPKFALSKGDVLLTREEFKRLVNSMLPPTDDMPTVTITKGTYKAKLVGDSIRVSAVLDLQLNKKNDKPVRVEIFPGDVAFREITFDDQPALTTLDAGKLYLTTPARGHHVVRLLFSVKNPEGAKAQSVYFPIQRTSITKVEFEIPEANVDLKVDQALQLETSTTKESSFISAVLPPSDQVRLSWHTVVPEKEKGPAKIYADQNHLVSIEEDALRVRSIINLQILKNSANAVDFEIPAGFSVIDVQGPSLKDWTESGKDTRVLHIPFEFARQGSFQIVVTSEQIFSDNKVSTSFAGLKLRGATREKGFIGVELKTSAEASAPNELKGLDRVDIQELPGDLVSLSNRPLLYGYRYQRYPIELKLDIERHANVQVLTSVIDYAHGLSWLDHDGKMVHQLTYTLRNTWKQFLEVKLPANAKLWSVFVAGQPVKPSENPDGKILIPLNRSQNVSGTALPFSVELVYYEQASAPSLIGKRNLEFPIPDMIVGDMSWSVVLPNDQVYGYFGKDLEKGRRPEPVMAANIEARRQTSGFGARALRVVAKSLSVADAAYDMKADANEMQEAPRPELEQLTTQKMAAPAPVYARTEAKMKSEVDGLVSRGRVAGVLPIRANVPVTGQSLVFSKSLIVKEVPVELPLYYISKEIITLIKLALIALLLFIAFRFISRRPFMKFKIPAFSAFVLAALFLGAAPQARADEMPEEPTPTATTTGEGALSLPWSEFEKILNTSRDTVTLTWAEFQQLIKQTGVEDMPDYEVQKGNVVLNRAEFKRLLDRMKAPASEAPTYYLTKAVYTGRIGQQSSRIKVQIRLQVVGKEGSAGRVRIPLFPGNTAFQEVLIDGQPALIENDGAWLYLTTSKLGDHVITATFSTASALKKGPQELVFNIPRTPITQLDLTVPVSKLDIQVDNAMQIDSIQVNGGTQIKAILPSSDAIVARWNLTAPEEKKGPAKIYSDVYNLLTVEEDALRVRTLIELDVLQNTINALNIKIPHGFNVLEVQGDSIGDWKVDGEGGVLVIPFQHANKGKLNLTVISELVLKDKNSVASFDGFQVLKSVREKGFVGVELKTSAEAKSLDIKGLDRVDTQELPQQLLNMANRPLLFGFKYLRQPYTMSLDIQRHEEVPVISTVIDEASGVTMVMEDGKRVHRMTYTVRNSWKQFLEISLPEGAQLWSASVEGQRVQPSKNDAGKILVPLNRSKAINGNLNSFEVEIMYYQSAENLKIAGKDALQFPIPDVVVSQMLWSVYLPINYDYLHFGGNVDKESAASGITPLTTVLSGRQEILKDLANLKNSEMLSKRRNFRDGSAIDPDSYARQVDKEVAFFQKVQEQAVQQAGEIGASPIRVRIPNTGKVFRFSKRIVVDQTPLNLTLTYLNHNIIRLLALGCWMIFAVALYRSRSRIMHLFRRVHEQVKAQGLPTWNKMVSRMVERYRHEG